MAKVRALFIIFCSLVSSSCFANDEQQCLNKNGNGDQSGDTCSDPSASADLHYPIPGKPSEQYHALKSPRGPKMAARTWQPTSSDATISAITLIIHGGGWHSGYFEDLAAALTNSDSNMFVCAYDQVGLGYSEPEPNAPEGYYHVNKLNDVIDDVYVAIEWCRKAVTASGIKRKEQYLPLFLFAESAGAPLALHAALQQETRNATATSGTKIDGIVLSGGLVKIGAGMLPPPFVVRILLFLGRLFPRVKMPATDTGATFDEAFGDVKWAATARADPATYVSIPATLGAASVLLGSGEAALARAHEFKGTMPILGVHGRGDVRTQLSAVEELVEAADGEMLVLETEGHQLLQDVPKIKNAAIEKVVSWIEGQLVA